MKSITAFKLSNGTIVENKAKAIKEQNEIDFVELVTNFAEANGCYESVDDIKNAILDNRHVLKAILNKFVK